MLLGRLLLAGVVAAALLALVDRLIGHAPAPSLLAETPPAWATDISTSLGSWNVAIAVAIYLVARPLLTVPYRRLAVGVITLSAVHVLLAGSELPRDILAAIACGFLAASSVLLALGRPMRPLDGSGRRGPAPDGRRRQRGPPASVDARGPAVLRDHDRRRRPLRQGPRPRGAQQRPAVPLLPLVALPRPGRRGDRVVPEAVDRARGAGVRAGRRRRHPHPRLLGVTEVDADRLALAFVRINGSSLDGVPAERLTDEVLRGIWRLVADLHRAGIAHRDLRLANLFLDDTARPG